MISRKTRIPGWTSITTSYFRRLGPSSSFSFLGKTRHDTRVPDRLPIILFFQKVEKTRVGNFVLERTTELGEFVKRYLVHIDPEVDSEDESGKDSKRSNRSFFHLLQLNVCGRRSDHRHAKRHWTTRRRGKQKSRKEREGPHYHVGTFCDTLGAGKEESFAKSLSRRNDPRRTNGIASTFRISPFTSGGEGSTT